MNASQLRFHLLDSRTVQLGFNMIKSCGGEVAKVLVQARTQRYASLRDLMQRTNIKRQAMENLIQAGACDSFGLDRRELLWQLWLIQRTGWGENDLFLHLEPPTPGLLESGPWDRIRAEYAVQGFSAHCHPLSLMRAKLTGATPAKDLRHLPDQSMVRVAGMVVCRQKPPTAKGFAFLTLEDETGLMNVIIHPQPYELSRYLFRQSPILIVEGIIQQKGAVLNIKATHLISA